MGHIGDGFYGSNDPTNSAKALKEQHVKEFTATINQINTVKNFNTVP